MVCVDLSLAVESVSEYDCCCHPICGVGGVSRKDWNKNEVQGVKMGNYHPK